MFQDSGLDSCAPGLSARRSRVPVLSTRRSCVPVLSTVPVQLLTEVSGIDSYAPELSAGQLFTRTERWTAVYQD